MCLTEYDLCGLFNLLLQPDKAEPRHEIAVITHHHIPLEPFEFGYGMHNLTHYLDWNP